MPARRSRTVDEPVLGRAQGPGILRPVRPEATRLPGALELPLDQLAADPRQPRQQWDHNDGERHLEDLTASVAEFGILQPLLVRPAADGEDGPPYRIVAGNRRFVAAQRAGLTMVPVIVRATDTLELRILQLTENLLRQDLAPLDEARAYQELIDLKKCSPRQLAMQLHISDQQVRLRLRLLSDQILADAVERRQIAANTARLIQQLPDEEQESFRERTRLGERLQENDLAAVRARLLAEGAIHPRRTRPAAGSAVSKTTNEPQPAAGAHTQSSVATQPGSGASEMPAAAQRADSSRAAQPGGGQIPFDPMPHTNTGLQRPEDQSSDAADRQERDAESLTSGGHTSLEALLTTVLAAADPGTKRLLGRFIWSTETPGADPLQLIEALRLAGALLKVLVPAAPVILALTGGDDE